MDWFLQAAMVAMKYPEKPGQRGSGEARCANHPLSGYKATTGLLGNTRSHTCLGRRRSLLGDPCDVSQGKPKAGRDADLLTYSQGNHTVPYMERQDFVKSR